MIVSLYQSIGLRDEQEDRLLSLHELGLYAVFDGLGGHDNGAEAAQAAADALASAAAVLRPSTPEAMGTAFAAAEAAVRSLGTSWHRSPATTASGVCFDGERAVIGHIGDTRIWRVRRVTNGKAEQLTKDHSFAGRFLEKCLGAQGSNEPDLFEVDVRPGDTFVLCSDGVDLSGEEIAEVLAAGPVETSAARLVEAGEASYAKKQSLTDNASAIVLRLGASP